MMPEYLSREEFIERVHTKSNDSSIRQNYEHCYLLAKDSDGIRVESTISAAGEYENLRIEEPCGFYLDTSLPLTEAYLKACSEHAGDIYLVERDDFDDEELEDRPVFDDFLAVEVGLNEEYYACDNKSVLPYLSKKADGLYYVFVI